MADWNDLDRELDAWATAGETATFWWRDDDAVTATPALQQLLALAAATAEPLPLALAVIPAGADAHLAEALQEARHVTVLQHGYAHANRAPAGAKKSEFPAGREVAGALDELTQGTRQLMDLFGARALPVLVPPWNRIDPELAARLAEIGIRGLSGYGARRAPTAGAGTVVVNTHVDIMRWHGRREFLGVQDCLALALAHLRARRQRRVDPAEPTGLLTHHLVHDAAAWRFLAELVQRSAGHRAARWAPAPELFGCGGSAGA
jgi:hypothetical protein